MRLRRAIPAGLADIGAASLGTFIVQAYAVRIFDADSLGAYALFFSAYIFASQATQFLFLRPLEIAVLDLPRSVRVQLVSRSVRLAAPAPLAAGAGVLLASLIAAPATDDLELGLAVTALAAATTAPLYEHLKRMLHLSDRSWHAAGIAQVQLISLVVMLVVLIALDVPSQWVPFAALAGSQVAGLLAVWTSLRPGTDSHQLETSYAALLRSGRWLLISGLMPPLATFIAAGLITRLAGAAELGLAQAAHVAGRPVLIMATGLSAVIGYRLMEAGSVGRAADGARYWRFNAWLLGAGGAAYAGLVGLDWAGNPMAALLPRAYEVGGLVLVTIGANLAYSLIRPARNELIGGRWESRVAGVDTAAAMAVVLVAAFSGPLEAFALPLGTLAAAVVLTAGYVRSRRAMYTGSSGDHRPETVRPSGG